MKVFIKWETGRESVLEKIREVFPPRDDSNVYIVHSHDKITRFVNADRVRMMTLTEEGGDA